MRGLPLRVVATIATLSAIALCALVVASWGWRAFGPAPVRIAAATPSDPAATILASGLLAADGAAPVVAAPKADATLATGETRLLGLFTERDGKGYALFRLPTGTRLVASGQEIAQGATLVAIHADGVTLRDAGGERRIALRASPPPPKAAAGTAATAPAKGARSAACTVPAGYKGAVLRLNAELFQGIIARPDSWSALVAPEKGALAVRDESGFGAMLAMKKGDRLEQANGVALAAPDDVIRAVLKPLAGGEAVRILGSRGGVAREWLLLNAGSCPA